MDKRVSDLMKLLKIFPNGEIPVIKENIKFWMIRSKRGYFYDEFKDNDYVAIGWNCIDSMFDFDDNKEIKKYVEESHPFVKQATRAINKCKKFIFEIKVNDIILIPNKGTKEILIALAGEYYEDKTKSIIEENEVTKKIDVEEGNLPFEVKCPYMKRRKIIPIRIVRTSKINPHLHKTLRNCNSLDDINEHAEIILGLIYNTFQYKDNIHISLEINHKGNIGLSDISGMLYGTNIYLKEINNKNNLKAKVNVCSEGSIDILIQNAVEILEQYGPGAIISLIAVLAIGYIMTKIDVPKLIKDLYNIPSEHREQIIKEKIANVELSLKNEELKAARLRNEKEESKLRAEEILLNVSEPLEYEPITISDDAYEELKRIQKN